jgi:hypothetical protein
MSLLPEKSDLFLNFHIPLPIPPLNEDFSYTDTGKFPPKNQWFPDTAEILNDLNSP